MPALTAAREERGREREQNPQLEKGGEEGKKERPLAGLVVASAAANAVAFAEEEAKKRRSKRVEWQVASFLPSFLTFRQTTPHHACSVSPFLLRPSAARGGTRRPALHHGSFNECVPPPSSLPFPG